MVSWDGQLGQFTTHSQRYPEWPLVSRTAGNVTTMNTVSIIFTLRNCPVIGRLYVGVGGRTGNGDVRSRLIHPRSSGAGM